MTKIVELSIITVNWRSLDYLCACLESIYRETSGVQVEIIVVDNASGDDSEAVISKEFPDVQFIKSPVNLGFARANNLGYARSVGEIVVFLNPDTEVIDNALGRMVAHLRAEESVGAVGARLLNSDGSLQMSCVQAFPTILNQMLDSEALRTRFPTWRIWGTKALFSDTNASADVISGACFMVKKRVFEEVSLFTEKYFMYGEDLDLSYKIARSGYRLEYLPNCRVTHHGGTSSAKQGPSFASVWQKESILQYFRSTRGEFYCNCYRAALAASASLRMIMVILSIPLVGLVFRSKSRRVAMLKWFTNFRWALGLNPAVCTQPPDKGESHSSDAGTNINGARTYD